METYTKFYKVAGITMEVRSDLPILKNTFHPKFGQFETDGPGRDNIIIHHHFSPPEKPDNIPWIEVYNKIPWRIYKTENDLKYERVHNHYGIPKIYCTAFFNKDHTYVDIYNSDFIKKNYIKGLSESLTLFPTDQILLARILADRKGCFFHSNGVVFDNKGFLFLGHSGYGKSTIANMLKNNGGKILCDDRIIIRQDSGNILMFGNWCYGKERHFSNDVFPVKAIFFISKSDNNKISKENTKIKTIHHLLSFIIKPFVTEDWWDNSFNLIEEIAQKVPCYHLMFDKSEKIVKLIKKL